MHLQKTEKLCKLCQSKHKSFQYSRVSQSTWELSDDFHIAFVTRGIMTWTKVRSNPVKTIYMKNFQTRIFQNVVYQFCTIKIDENIPCQMFDISVNFEDTQKSSLDKNLFTVHLLSFKTIFKPSLHSYVYWETLYLVKFAKFEMLNREYMQNMASGLG